MMQMNVDAAGEISNLDSVQLMEVGIAVLQTSAIDDNARNSVPFRKLSGKNYKLF